MKIFFIAGGENFHQKVVLQDPRRRWRGWKRSHRRKLLPGNATTAEKRGADFFNTQLF